MKIEFFTSAENPAFFGTFGIYHGGLLADCCVASSATCQSGGIVKINENQLANQRKNKLKNNSKSMQICAKRCKSMQINEFQGTACAR